jgi:hypothetical protein
MKGNTMTYQDYVTHASLWLRNGDEESNAQCEIYEKYNGVSDPLTCRRNTINHIKYLRGVGQNPFAYSEEILELDEIFKNPLPPEVPYILDISGSMTGPSPEDWHRKLDIIKWEKRNGA